MVHNVMVCGVPTTLRVSHFSSPSPVGHAAEHARAVSERPDPRLELVSRPCQRAHNKETVQIIAAVKPKA